MKKYTYTEFIRYDEGFKKGKNDFYGPLSPLSEAETKEFFGEYVRYMKREYGEDCLNAKAVPEEQLKGILFGLGKREGLVFSASKRKRSSGYKSWQLYTDRATLKGNTITLADGYSVPTAAAKCELLDKVGGLSLSVYFDEAYRRPIPGGALITTPGKMIELRCGIVDSVRLFFAEDGELLVRVNDSGDAYHFGAVSLGSYPFGEKFTLKFEFSESGYTLTGLGNSVTLPYLLGKRPDTLFLSGGLQPTSFWRVGVDSAISEDGESIDLFAADSEEYTEELIGEVELPYAIGTEGEKDKELILRTSFVKNAGLSYALRLESLDPSGDVYINGKRVCHTDSFEPLTVCLDAFSTEGDNEIKLIIPPRAPELNYIWHRHKDPYNGWFSLSAELLCGREIPEGRAVVTAKGENIPESFEVFWETALLGEVDYKAYIRKTYPNIEAYKKLSEGKLDNCNLNFANICNCELWSPDNPVLYEIKIELYRGGELIYSDSVETGFRIIRQRDGAIYLNGEKTILKGALNMQFLPPYDEVPINHVCPSYAQITEEMLALKNMNGNCLRLHQLGHGSSDKRFAEIADRLGVMLIWTTRAIDSAEQILWNRSDAEPWRLAELYKGQMRPFLNYPSIIMWEGSNELHSGLCDLDRLYDSFVTAVREVDNSRLICPVSHLYYGGGLYGGPDATTDYYNNDGTRAADGEEVRSSFGWLDPSVVRSSHTYSLLLGYGAPWQNMVKQDWKWQKELFEAKDKAYIVSEFAIIGRQNPSTEGAKEFFNGDSYELGNEKAALGYIFDDGEWELGQGYQALCADMAIRQLRRFDADGMIWCALRSGANNGSYLKPPIDFMGYTKLAFYRMKAGFSVAMAVNAEPDALLYKGYKIMPVCTGLSKGKSYSLLLELINKDGNTVASCEYPPFIAKEDIVTLSEAPLKFFENGYYGIRYSLAEE